MTNATMAMKPEGEAINHQPKGADHRSGADEIDLLAIGRVLRRHKGLIIVTTFLLTAIVVAVTMLLSPKYSATAYIMIYPGQVQVVDAVAAVVAGSSADSAQVDSEARVLQSRGLAERVVKELKLDQDPEFNPALLPPSPLDRVLSPINDVVAAARSAAERQIAYLLGRADDKADKDPAQTPLDGVVNGLLSRLEVVKEGLSRVIGVTVTSEKPETAARVANALTDFYIAEQLESKFGATRSASEWLNSNLAELRQRVEAAEDAVEKYRSEHGLLASGDVTMSTRETTELISQLAGARSQRAEAEARLREAQSAVGGTSAISDVLGSGLIQQLRVQEAEIQRRISDLSQRVGRNHPDLLGAQAELGEIRVKIESEVQKVVERLRNDVTAAKAREAALNRGIETLKAQVSGQNQVQVKMRALEREAVASRTLLESFLTRSQEASSQENYQQADARVVSRAGVPRSPSFPKKKILVPAGFLASLACGVLLAFLLESMDSGFRSEEQVEQVLGIASLGLVPSLKRPWGKSKRASTYVVQHPASPYVESIRNLYTGLRLSNGNHIPRVILIASSLPNEGKTTVAVSFASFLSVTGLRTIIVDTDLRRPSVHRALGIEPKPGLVDCLHHQVPLTAVIQRDEATGIDAIAAGSTAVNSPHLLGTEKMVEVLLQLKEIYDVVILDSAPLLAVSDTRILGRIADKTIFLVRWADTRRDTAVRALHQVEESRRNVAGIMLTMVDFDKYTKLRYGEFAHYYRRIEGYYGS